MRERILVINPGSTSTKIALFEGENELWSEELAHEKAELARFGRVVEQLDFRREAIRKELARHEGESPRVNAVVGRGGLLRPMPGGAYAIGPGMLADLAGARYGEHPCNLGALLAAEFAQAWDVPAFIVDPVVTDEMREVARVTGLPGLKRRSVFHALSQRGAARLVAGTLGVRYEEGKFLVAHMGGGISIGAHERGRVVDVINALDGEGPMSPERTGRLPLIPLLNRLERGEFTLASLRRTVLVEGGLYGHLGTNDFRQVEAWAKDPTSEKRELATLLVQALAYNIAKELAGLAPALMVENSAPILAVVLTGGLARSALLVEEIRRRIEFLAPVHVVPESVELTAMAQGALRVLRGECAAGEY
jgi:butyrate kinase